MIARPLQRFFRKGPHVPRHALHKGFHRFLVCVHFLFDQGLDPQRPLTFTLLFEPRVVVYVPRPCSFVKPLIFGVSPFP